MRAIRLGGTILLLAGSAGTIAAALGLMGATEGTLAFPLSVVVGILILVTHRPRKARKRRG